MYVARRTTKHGVAVNFTPGAPTPGFNVAIVGAYTPMRAERLLAPPMGKIVDLVASLTTFNRYASKKNIAPTPPNQTSDTTRNTPNDGTSEQLALPKKPTTATIVTKVQCIEFTSTA